MKIIISMLIINCFISMGFAQNRNISGTITDKQGAPVKDAIVTAKGTNITATSDEKGHYAIIIPSGCSTVKFSKQGMAGIDISVENKQSIDVILASEEQYVFSLSLDELLQLQVTSSSLRKEKANVAASNITLVTKEMITERGYRSLVEVCEDLPGFDFLMYEDGGGEYTSPFVNMRGIGNDQGSAKILVMVDGVPQNLVNFNWSTQWQFSNMLHDLDRIEIIQGPGSAIYGAQAYSGVINMITKSKYEGAYAKYTYGSNNTSDLQLMFGKKLKEDCNLSLSFRNYYTDGDQGIGRYDPGNFFKDNVYPYYQTQNYKNGKYIEKGSYDANGNKVGNGMGFYNQNGVYSPGDTNILGGTKLQDGFNNRFNDFSFRLKLETKNSEMGLFFWDEDRGSASYVCAYLYNLRSSDFRAHHRGYDAYFKNTIEFNSKLSLESNLVYRTTSVLPQSGGLYNYRFVGLAKQFYHYGNQGYMEERFNYKINENHNILLGLRLMSSIKMMQSNTLGLANDETLSTAQSSWEMADQGKGLNVLNNVPFIRSTEYAGYLLWNGNLGKNFVTSVGSRFDYSKEYGRTINPRLCLIYLPTEKITIKAMYGSAFKQPSIYEVNFYTPDKPADLKPEKINTYELEGNLQISKGLSIKANLFFSDLKDELILITDSSAYYLKRYANQGKESVRGASVSFNIQPIEHLMVYGNYIFTEGKINTKDKETSWGDIDKVAAHKVNIGVGYSFWKNKMHVDYRMNMVGNRKAPQTNRWLQNNENGYAPGYNKSNLSISYNFYKKCQLQLVVRNMFDEQFYGIGRDEGSGLKDEFNPITNIKPAVGYIPPYHPQPGRTFTLGLTVEL